MFLQMMVKLIEAMTARILSQGLKVDSPQEMNIKEFLEYLNEWETSLEPSKTGFTSGSIAEGLRVTLHATLGLLRYASEKLNFKFMLTNHLSEDCIEKCFGVIRQFSGRNDHPTAMQFLITVNCLSFYDSVKAPNSGSCSGGSLTSLLGDDSSVKQVDALIDNGKLEEASGVLEKSELDPDHVHAEKTSDA